MSPQPLADAIAFLVLAAGAVAASLFLGRVNVSPAGADPGPLSRRTPASPAWW